MTSTHLLESFCDKVFRLGFVNVVPHLHARGGEQKSLATRLLLLIYILIQFDHLSIFPKFRDPQRSALQPQSFFSKSSLNGKNNSEIRRSYSLFKDILRFKPKKKEKKGRINNNNNNNNNEDMSNDPSTDRRSFTNQLIINHEEDRNASDRSF